MQEIVELEPGMKIEVLLEKAVREDSRTKIVRVRKTDIIAFVDHEYIELEGGDKCSILDIVRIF